MEGHASNIISGGCSPRSAIEELPEVRRIGVLTEGEWGQALHEQPRAAQRVPQKLVAVLKKIGIESSLNGEWAARAEVIQFVAARVVEVAGEAYAVVPALGNNA